MRLCIPVRQPLGLDSEMEPNLPSAEHLLFFDTESRAHETLSLLQTPPETAPSFEAVLCGSINRVTLRALIERGIQVYGTEARTVADAIAQYEKGELRAVPSAASGGCGSHSSHGHAHGTGGCGGGGCGSHSHEHAETGCGGGGCGGHGGGCGSHGQEQAHGEGGHVCGGGGCGGRGQAHEPTAGEGSEPRAIGDVLRIAVTSQNRKTITEHAGKCRKFWVYEVHKGQVVAKNLIELPKDQSFHEAKSMGSHPLDDIHVLISSGMGTGLQQRLRQRGIQGLVTAETDPDQAVALYLEAALSDLPPQRAWVSTCSQEKAEA